jgi:hypothetical protein
MLYYKEDTRSLMKKTLDPGQGMSQGWEDRRRVMEEEYFKQQNQQALKTLKISQPNPENIKSAGPGRSEHGSKESLLERLRKFLRI